MNAPPDTESTSLTHTVKTMVDSELYNWIKGRAAEKHLPVSSFIRMTLAEKMDEESNE